MKTSSGATAVQIVSSFRRRSRNIEHIGSAHDAQFDALKSAAALKNYVANTAVSWPGRLESA